MEDSSFIISPITADFSDVWSEPELLSAKGHSAIYLATRFGRRYILKSLTESYRESTPHIEMLRKEFSIGVGIDHPNIVRLLDFGHMDSIGWYIQMEYIDGITLEQYLATHPSVKARQRVLFQLLDALSCLHERQIIHRDIKPSNILVTRNGSSVKLIDFGVSDTDDYVTFKQPAGSMAYIAPEQLSGQAIDNRADIFAVGRIIQLLFPHRYTLIARRCTRANPTHRYGSCAHIGRAVQRTDRLLIGLPFAILLLVALSVAVLGTYTAYQHSEQLHIAQESQLFANIDSLRVQNNQRQALVDSLNRVVDSLVVKANTPSARELIQKKAVNIHLARYAAICEAVKKGEIKTRDELSSRMYENIDEEFDEAQNTIKDPVLREAFREAYYAYYLHKYSQLFDSLINTLPAE